ncbi:hypothetical protein, conserved [Eimeria necatrix]|uniref:Uncharacterized protein n=1 Tax=Eimeria necatrix TaxID=51315 RepID=U6MMN2_9EIME|nr:hypothetical protein, conserved [Eimeria necatrix]CDJ65276.1 hypothetical protein, conserved [Eimeria necatrix]
MRAAAVGGAGGAPAAFTAMMETHKDFEEALDLVFDGPADVLVGTRPDLRSRHPQRESPSPGQRDNSSKCGREHKSPAVGVCPRELTSRPFFFIVKSPAAAPAAAAAAALLRKDLQPQRRQDLRERTF